MKSSRYFWREFYENLYKYSPCNNLVKSLRFCFVVRWPQIVSELVGQGQWFFFIMPSTIEPDQYFWTQFRNRCENVQNSPLFRNVSFTFFASIRKFTDFGQNSARTVTKSTFMIKTLFSLSTVYSKTFNSGRINRKIKNKSQS